MFPENRVDKKNSGSVPVPPETETLILSALSTRPERSKGWVSEIFATYHKKYLGLRENGRIGEALADEIHRRLKEAPAGELEHGLKAPFEELLAKGLIPAELRQDVLAKIMGGVGEGAPEQRSFLAESIAQPVRERIREGLRYRERLILEVFRDEVRHREGGSLCLVTSAGSAYFRDGATGEMLRIRSHADGSRPWISMSHKSFFVDGAGKEEWLSMRQKPATEGGFQRFDVPSCEPQLGAHIVEFFDPMGVVTLASRRNGARIEAVIDARDAHAFGQLREHVSSAVTAVRQGAKGGRQP